MKNTWKIAAAAMLAAAALAVTAMPTKRQLVEAQKLVNDLTADDIRAFNAKHKTAGEVAAKHLDLLDKAETEACKYLLLQGAFRLYARGGDYDAAADILQRMKKVISDVPPEVIVELVNGEMRRGTESKAPRVLAIYNDAKHTIKYRKLLETAEAEVKKRGTSTALKNLAECHACLGNWDDALKFFARARVSAAKWELDPKSVSDCDAFKAAEFWWSYKAEETAPFRAHAAALYRKALDNNLVTGLYIEIAKQRIADVETRGRTGGSPVPDMNGRASRSTKGLYCVVDLSAGPNAMKYPVSYLPSAPKGDWTDEYKTTKLVLRRIEPGTFIMGADQKDESHRVKITKPFYIGVFEVTQKQYELVTGNNPSKYPGDMRPVENLSWEMLRGSAAEHDWPKVKTVAPDTFIGRVRAKTGISGFDLPTQAQWEYACRAGTTTDRYDGSNLIKNGEWHDSAVRSVRRLGRCAINQKVYTGEPRWVMRWHKKPDGKGGFSSNTTTVGLYAPNAWGLYDMYGNSWEKCVSRQYDTWGENPVGRQNGKDERVVCGGGWNSSANAMVSSSIAVTPSNKKGGGFRLALTISSK